MDNVTAAQASEINKYADIYEHDINYRMGAIRRREADAAIARILPPKPELLHYITAKSALHGFTKALAAELAPKGIRINSISPGMTDTDLLANVPEKVKLLTAAQTPLRTIAKPDDVVGAISYLASHKSDYLTGETIRVNGGQIMI